MPPAGSGALGGASSGGNGGASSLATGGHGAGSLGSGSRLGGLGGGGGLNGLGGVGGGGGLNGLGGLALGGFGLGAGGLGAGFGAGGCAAAGPAGSAGAPARARPVPRSEGPLAVRAADGAQAAPLRLPRRARRVAGHDAALGGLANLQAIATSLSAANLAQAGPLLAQVNFLPDAKQPARGPPPVGSFSRPVRRVCRQSPPRAGCLPLRQAALTRGACELVCCRRGP
jgi:hypothetical protein